MMALHVVDWESLASNLQRRYAVRSGECGARESSTVQVSALLPKELSRRIFRSSTCMHPSSLRHLLHGGKIAREFIPSRRLTNSR